MRAMHTAATGMDAQVMRIDTIANNLSNAQTTGYKESQVDFADLMYESVRRPGGARTQDTSMPSGLQVGSGVKPVSTLKVFTPGSLKNTGGELDMAIEGRGFFQVEGPNGRIYYTRDGHFSVNSEGIIVNSEGYRLYPSLTVPRQAQSIEVGSDGTVTVTMPGDSGQTEVGSIELATFANPGGLSSEGGNMYAETAASGAPQTRTPGTEGAGKLQQGYLEKSNVDVVSELVDLIRAQRTYELNSKVVKAGDRVLQATNYLLR